MVQKERTLRGAFGIDICSSWKLAPSIWEMDDVKERALGHYLEALATA